MKKIMISVAPVAATDILINPRAIARDVYECYKNGASMVHLHCRDLNGNLTPDVMDELREETPLGQIGTPQQIADCAWYLAGEGAAFLTGQVISPNGGFLI